MPYFVIARFEEVDELQFVPFWNEAVKPQFEAMNGLARHLLMRDVDSEGSFLHLAMFESEEHAKSGFENMVDTLERDFGDRPYFPPAPDVHWVIPDSQRAYDRAKVLSGDIYSLSTQNVGLGFAAEATQRLEYAFEEIHSLPGLGGYVIGHRQSLQDEITALATWDTVDAARASIPAASGYAIRIYETVR